MLSDSDLPRLAVTDPPWKMRTYAGHSSAEDSNALYHTNLSKGQTGLSIAFDLPTQTGYDPDDELSQGEVGKVGVSIAHTGDMRTLLEGISLDQMNTSMTINATAAWLLSLYIVEAQRQKVDVNLLRGTTQNDILKEFLSRGTYILPPEASLRLTADMIAYTSEYLPKWNPINICSYHLQEAGATPVQEIAFMMSNAIAVLDATRERISEESLARVFGQVSFFVNSGIRFVEEHAKLRAMSQLWKEIGKERYGITDEKHLRFRYGVQVNSLGLTQDQPENNIQRIVLETLPAVLGRDVRARAVQLPAWNEALGLPRPFDQQWSLRIQQILAHESDILEYPDIFEGSFVMEALVAELLKASKEEMAVIAERGGAVASLEYMKAALVSSNRERTKEIESGEQIVVGQNKFTLTEDSPLTKELETATMSLDPVLEAERIAAIHEWREHRDQKKVQEALAALAAAASKPEENLMIASLEAARRGATVGEWAEAMRSAFGSFKPLTGMGVEVDTPAANTRLEEISKEVKLLKDKLGRRPKLLIGKPGLDGHSNAAEQVALRARDAGFDVVYEGIRLTPSRIAVSASQEGVHLIGLSILSGSHRQLIPAVLSALEEEKVHVPVVIGGLIPEQDIDVLKKLGVREVYTAKDDDITEIVADMIKIISESL
jgi:(2R)-ethylmalonyl-CoA mutase